MQNGAFSDHEAKAVNRTITGCGAGGLQNVIQIHISLMLLLF